MNSELVNEIYEKLKNENSIDESIKNNNVKTYKNGLKIEHFTLSKKVENLNPGYYTILNFEKLYENLSLKKYFILKLANELKEYINESNNKNILIVGLGNRHINADSLGSKVLNELIVTRHIKNLKTLKKVSAISPSVLGLTGIESYDIVNSIIKSIKPTLVITIDSLCASSVSRLGTSFQINNAGIIPGGGINNSRKEFNSKTLNTNFISIGVPLIIYANTINPNKSFKNLIVTIKDIEEISLIDSHIIAYALNIAIHNLTIPEINEILNKI